MPCPCEGNGNIDSDREHVFLRFIGGKDKVGRIRGKWRTYETGRIYRTLPEFDNAEAYPYWVPSNEKEFCDQEEELAKAREESVTSTSSEQDDVTLSTELPEVEEINLDQSYSEGLVSEFSDGTLNEELIRGMDDQLLKTYIASNGGEVNKRWKRKRLIQEALKL